MPGIRIMNDSAADAREGESRKRDHDGRLINGDQPPRKDAAAAAANGAVQHPMNGALAPSARAPAPVPSPDRMSELPPELAHQGPETYRPLQLLIERTAQEAFNDITDTLRSMADIQVPQQPNGAVANGLGNYGAGSAESAELNRKKKLLLLNFAQTTRAKFIKLLVMLGWARKYAEPVSKLIDVFSWMSKHAQASDFVDEQVSIIKNWTKDLGERNPDLRTALEVLTTGEAAWVPDLKFIPPEPLTPEKALKLLRYMNTALAIRLNVHEDLPRHLKKWRIHDGRVTFTIDGEFEMDLITSSEDTAWPWWIVDMRLLFSPSPEIDIQSQFWKWLEQGATSVLAERGIVGAFDILHSFVLTHKIAVLRSQAHRLLVEAAWFGAIKVFPVHRQLVVQYWIDRPGKKNWLEIGISSNKPKNGKVSWRGPPVSSLAARWFRAGVEVKDVDFKFDYNNLSMELMLRRIVALHISTFLSATRDAIPPQMTAKASLSDTAPADSSLEISLGKPDNKITLLVEPVTGKYILHPRKQTTAGAEHYINDPRNAHVPIGPTLTQLLAQMLQESIQRCATQLGWEAAPKGAFRAEAVKQATKLDVIKYTMYRPIGWTQTWALTVTIDVSGEQWWIWELGSGGTKIEHAERLALAKSGPSPPITRDLLSSIDRIAVQQLGFRVTRREFTKLDIPSAVEQALVGQSSASSTPSFGETKSWALYVRTSDLIRMKTSEAEGPWINEHVRIVPQGFSSNLRTTSHIAFGNMVKSVAADMKKLMSASSQQNFIFREDGKFAILLSAPFGEPVVEELRARLRDIDRLRSFATILQKRQMTLRRSSLQAVQFQYGPDNMTATVSFQNNDEIQVDFGPNNPHNRIKTFLTELINERPPYTPRGPEISGLDRFCATLLCTRPVLAKLDELENSAPGNLQNPTVFAHNVGKYRVSYANPLCSFDIKMQQKGEAVIWQIIDNNAKQPDLRPLSERNHVRIESLKTAIGALFKGQGPGWFGVRDGIIAPFTPSVPAMQDALQKLHDAVVACAMEGGYKHTLERPEVAAAVKQGATATPAPAPTPLTMNAKTDKGMPQPQAGQPQQTQGVRPQQQQQQQQQQKPTAPQNAANAHNLKQAPLANAGDKAGQQQQQQQQQQPSLAQRRNLNFPSVSMGPNATFQGQGHGHGQGSQHMQQQQQQQQQQGGNHNMQNQRQYAQHQQQQQQGKNGSSGAVQNEIIELD